MIDVGRVQQQENNVDCGVYAVAFATHQAYGVSPIGVVFDLSKMREHLIECLESNKMTMFPTIARRGKFCAVEHFVIKIYCLCNNIFHPARPMVFCNKCREWFHTDCVIREEKKRKAILSENNNNSWYCADCENESDDGL